MASCRVLAETEPCSKLASICQAESMRTRQPRGPVCEVAERINIPRVCIGGAEALQAFKRYQRIHVIAYRT